MISGGIAGVQFDSADAGEVNLVSLHFSEAMACSLHWRRNAVQQGGEHSVSDKTSPV